MSDTRFLRAYGETDFITGLRAIAATMVVIIHSGAFLNWGAIGTVMTGAGKYGVDIFFVISGFAIAKTFTEARGYRPYLTRRLMRILPLYYLLITLALLGVATGLIGPTYWMAEFGTAPDLYNWLMHLSLFSYLDYRVANSALGVEWSIPIEIFWYLVLPLILGAAQSLKRAALGVVVMLVLTGIVTYLCKQALGTSLPVKWTPIAQGHLFLLGAWAFFFRQRLAGGVIRFGRLWVALALVLMLSAGLLDFDGRGEAFALATVILIALLHPAQFGGVCRVLSGRVLLFLGSISYSIYLIHPLVIQGLERAEMIAPEGGILQFLLIYAVTVALSCCTYLLVEKPSNALGRRLAGRK